MSMMPTVKPDSPYFSSGPTKKIPHWHADMLRQALVQRSHRSTPAVNRIQQVLTLMRSVLNLPDSYKIAIVPGSATGANECGLWSFLGLRGVDVFAWDVFGKHWGLDVMQQLPLPDQRIFVSDFGKIPDFNQYDPQRDTIFTWNGTTSGVCVPDVDWIPSEREGLTICDATSAAFIFDMDWSKLDVTAFSWQKGLGGEAAHGVLVLSPKAVQQLTEYTPSWPIPRLFRLTNEDSLISDLYEGKTLNTPSMLCVEDCLQALLWAEAQGEIKGLVAKTKENFKVIQDWVQHHPLLKLLADDEKITSPVSVCLNLKDQTIPAEQQDQLLGSVAAKLDKLGVAYDIKNHYLAPPSLRIWCGPTVEKGDIEKLLPWIDWALAEQE